MKQQEFVIAESEKYVDNSKPVELDECSWQVVDESFSDGLTKGLEIAKQLLDFAVNKYFSVERLDGNTYWAKSGETGGIQYLTTDELLTIFLTEKYGK